MHKRLIAALVIAVIFGIGADWFIMNNPGHSFRDWYWIPAVVIGILLLGWVLKEESND